jgi:flagellar biosynthetic protein FlhB
VPEERFEERTEPATPRKREEARQEGNVSRSADLNSAILLLTAIGLLMWQGPQLVARMGGLVGELLSLRPLLEAPAVGGFGVGEAVDMMRRYAWLAFLVLLPLLAAMMGAAFLVNVAQVGFLFTTRVFLPRPEKFDVVAGLRRLFSMRGTIRAAFGVLKLLVVLAVVLFRLWGEQGRLIELGRADFDAIAVYLGRTALSIALWAAIALLILALLDWSYQRWQYERDLRMSKQEIKEEMKRYEGDPRIKERRRSIQRQMALQRMLGKVPTATVVITNPTHFAVALRYDPPETPAPQCVAKGAGRIAEQIIEKAAQAGVHVYRKPEVARALYAAVEPGQYIPPELYVAVAEAIAYVMRLKGMAGKSAA